MPIIREARPDDAEALERLIAELGFRADAAQLRLRIAAIARAGFPVLVAEDEGVVVGCLTWHIMPVIHRDTYVGRISTMVVDHERRGQGIGRALVREAERRMASAGCRLAEVTSNEKLADAHRFYERLGYERTSLRFGKTIGG